MVSRRRVELVVRLPLVLLSGVHGALPDPRRASGSSLGERFAAGAARGLSAAFHDLGGAFVKFGQLIGSSPGLFRPEVSDAFRGFLDTGAALEPRVVEDTVRTELGRGRGEAFDEFDDTPLAAASIAVVHGAVLDGRPVVVKLLRPGIERTVTEDCDAIEGLVVPLLRGRAEGAPLVTYVRALRAEITDEVDLRLEARSMQRFATLYERAGFDRLVVPRVVESHATTRLLTMERVDGVPIDSPDGLATLRRDPSALRQLLRAWMTTAVRHGEFHGDLHAGNVLVLSDARIALIDWGIVGRLDPAGRILFENILRGSLTDDLTPWETIAELYRAAELLTYGDAWNMTTAQVATTIRNQMRPVMTTPLRDVDISTLVVDPAAIRKVLCDDNVRPPGWREALRSGRESRELERKAQQSGARGGDFDVSSWMLAKQLLYIDRYLKAVLPDDTLTDDRDFFEELLAVDLEH